MDEENKVTLETIQQNILDKLAETEPGTEAYEKLTQQLSTITKQINETDRVIQEGLIKANELGEQSIQHSEEMELRRDELKMAKRSDLLSRIGKGVLTASGFFAGWVFMEFSKEDVIDKKLWGFIEKSIQASLGGILGKR